MATKRPFAKLCIKCLVSFLLAVALIAVILAWLKPWQDTDRDGAAKAMPDKDAMGDYYTKVAYPDGGQGWTPAQSLWFYNTTQGSDLLPYNFFLVLTKPNSDELVRSDANMNELRYLPQNKTSSNPDALPVGFVKDEYEGKEYVGFTCAACHTGQVNYKGTGLRVDGAPAMADMGKFLDQLAKSLRYTQDNPEALKKFVTAVQALDHSAKAENIVKELGVYTLRIRSYNYINDSYYLKEGKREPLAYGYARLDAFGRIYNRVLEHILDKWQLEQIYDDVLTAKDEGAQALYDFGEESLDQELSHTLVKSVHVPTGVNDALTPAERDALHTALAKKAGSDDELLGKWISRDFNSPNAPVSYPFLWDIAQHDYVQWNGLASNAGLGPLGRNAGEVVGVFGTLDWRKTNSFSISNLVTGQGFSGTTVKFQSSINSHNLRLIEEQLGALHSPAWPEKLFGALDPAQMKLGAQLYAKMCESCHALIAPTDPDRRVVAQMTGLTESGADHTDPTMADNSVKYQGYSGILRNLYASTTEGGNILLDQKAPVAALLTLATTGAVATPYPHGGIFGPIERFWDWLTNLIASFRSNDIKASLKSGDYTPDTTAKPYASLQAYKGRPLNGIWATAPYLHNGSVPTLRDLLTAPAKRPPTFLVGSREFVPEDVGFRSQGYEGGFLFDTSKPGNSNEGHDYGVGSLTKEQQDALLTYLKSL